MQQPHNRYRYVITNRLGVQQVEPLSESDFVLQWDRETEGRLYYKKEMPSRILFRGETFKRLLKLEKSIYRCGFTFISIERYCTDTGVGQWVPWFSGRMSFNDGDWNISKCQVVLKMDNVKPEQCYEDNKTKEIDLFFVTITRRSLSLRETNVEIEYKIFTTDNNAYPDACVNLVFWGENTDPYTLGYNYYYYRLDETVVFGQQTCQLTTRWAREVIYVPCGQAAPGTEWILVDDQCATGGQQKFARPVRTFSCVYTYPDYLDITRTTSYECQIVGATNSIQVIDNGMLLEEALAYFTNTYCPGTTVVSDFFQINPLVPSIINYVTGTRSKTRFITIFQKSDVKRPNAANNATRALITWEKLMNALIEMFNCRWRIEGGNVLRIEHVSYFTGSIGHDLTTDRYKKYIQGLNAYGYESQDIKAKENFRFMEGSPGDFEGLPILYSGGCVSSASRSNEENHNVEYVTTDIQLCLSNPEPDSKKVDDNGFVFAAADYDGTNYFIISEGTILGPTSQINNSLGWAQLHRDYWKFDRPLSSGTMNGQPTQFLSVRPTKKGKPITIPFCCGDTFDPEDQIKTEIGTGIVDKATYSFKAETLQVQILYNADENLTTNTAPVAVGDNVFTYVNLPLTIDVLGNDSDPDPGSTVTALQILVQPLHGVLTITPAFQVIYTPEPNYTGDDGFIYRFLDDWSEPSNNAFVHIIVRPGNQPPVAVNDAFFTDKNTAYSQGAPGLFINDSDDVGFTLSTYDAVSVQGGTVLVNTDGSFTYTPPTGYVGPDSFTYTIIDNQGLTSTGTVTIGVRDPNNPIANDDFYTARKNQVLSIAAPGLLSNDFTQIGVLSVIPQNVSTVQGGSVSIGNNGSFTYTPPVDYIGPDSFIYTISNGTGNAQATANIEVIPNIYVRLVKLSDNGYQIQLLCGGTFQYGGEYRIATWRLYFYSDAAGTIPYNTSNLIVNGIKTGTQYNQPGTTIDFFDVLGNGVQTDLLTTYEYYRFELGCTSGSDPVVYRNESISLAAGNYTVI